MLHFIVGLVLSTAARAGDPPADPTALAAEAVEANPAIDALANRVAQLDALADVADLWPDPVLGLEVSNLPVGDWGLGDHMMAGLQFRVQQTIPTPGVTGLRREVAEARRDVAEASLAEARLQLARAVETAYWRLALVRRLRVITAEHVEITDQLLGAVRARYETGGAGQHALVRLQVLRDRLIDDVHDFDRQDARLSAALREALHRPPDAEFATPDALDAAPLDSTDAAEAVRTWLDAARDARPALAEQRAAEEAAKLEARLARVDARPDLTVWGGYRLRTVDTPTDPGTDLVSLGVAVPLSFFQSTRLGRGRAAAALASAAAPRARQDSVLDGISADLQTAWADWRRAVDKVAAYDEDLIPGARRALDATLADYRVGKAPFESLYEAELQLLELQRARDAAAAETHIQEAVVRALVGQATGTGENR